ncbi:histone-arginine methyltransferase METTL23-like isoform X2 [Ptychodera flava]|uniref:histone-arginine methyltransferase METTL23-like isoform X2 n=1 Tax=Ptychodera flava TaxID=63121 RepID=UPI00396A0C3E
MASNINYRKLIFQGGAGGEKEDCLEVTIPEILDPHYGMYIWPCAPVLAQYLWYNKHKINGSSILELGAGTSLPGVVAAKCGAKVILSDARQFPRCLENCKRSCQANDLQDVDVVGITWGDFSRELFELPTLDFIVASDCFYDTKDFEDVLATVYFLLDRNPDARFLCTYQERKMVAYIGFMFSSPWNSFLAIERHLYQSIFITDLINEEDSILSEDMSSKYPLLTSGDCVINDDLFLLTKRNGQQFS